MSDSSGDKRWGKSNNWSLLFKETFDGIPRKIDAFWWTYRWSLALSSISFISRNRREKKIRSMTTGRKMNPKSHRIFDSAACYNNGKYLSLLVLLRRLAYVWYTSIEIIQQIISHLIFYWWLEWCLSCLYRSLSMDQCRCISLAPHSPSRSFQLTRENTSFLLV